METGPDKKCCINTFGFIYFYCHKMNYPATEDFLIHLQLLSQCFSRITRVVNTSAPISFSGPFLVSVSISCVEVKGTKSGGRHISVHKQQGLFYMCQRSAKMIWIRVIYVLGDGLAVLLHASPPMKLSWHYLSKSLSLFQLTFIYVSVRDSTSTRCSIYQSSFSRHYFCLSVPIWWASYLWSC